MLPDDYLNKKVYFHHTEIIIGTLVGKEVDSHGKVTGFILQPAGTSLKVKYAPFLFHLEENCVIFTPLYIYNSEKFLNELRRICDRIPKEIILLRENRLISGQEFQDKIIEKIPLYIQKFTDKKEALLKETIKSYLQEIFKKASEFEFSLLSTLLNIETRKISLKNEIISVKKRSLKEYLSKVQMLQTKLQILNAEINHINKLIDEYKHNVFYQGYYM